MTDAIVLGAGIVGVSTAIHLQKRGRSVLLVDRREPGRETSYGNAGIIQAEGVRPRGFPRDFAAIWKAARNAGIDSRYRLGAASTVRRAARALLVALGARALRRYGARIRAADPQRDARRTPT